MLDSETEPRYRIHMEMDSASSAAHFQSKDKIDLESPRKRDAERHRDSNALLVYGDLIF
jgi:hypothetical protein